MGHSYKFFKKQSYYDTYGINPGLGVTYKKSIIM